MSSSQKKRSAKGRTDENESPQKKKHNGNDSSRAEERTSFDDLGLEPLEDVSNNNNNSNANNIAPVDPVERLIAPIPVPCLRQWQMSDDDVKVCVFSFEAWKIRYIAFSRLPKIMLDTDDPMVKEQLANRCRELRYLSNELYNIWSTGGSVSLDPSALYNERGGAGNLPAIRRNIDPLAVAFALFFGKCDRVNMNPAFIDTRMEHLNSHLMGMLELHRMYVTLLLYSYA